MVKGMLWISSLVSNTWIHFIPIQTDLSNLCEKVEWVKNNEEKSYQIGESARSFIRDRLGLQDINLYIAKLIHRTGELYPTNKRGMNFASLQQSS